LLYFGSERDESLPYCCAEFPVGHFSSSACQQAVDDYPHNAMVPRAVH
jgi:hypothetical protein